MFVIRRKEHNADLNSNEIVLSKRWNPNIDVCICLFCRQRAFRIDRIARFLHMYCDACVSFYILRFAFLPFFLLFIVYFYTLALTQWWVRRRTIHFWANRRSFHFVFLFYIQHLNLLTHVTKTYFTSISTFCFIFFFSLFSFDSFVSSLLDNKKFFSRSKSDCISM